MRPLMTPAFMSPYAVYGAVPPSVNPSGVLPPPPAAVEMRELAQVRALNAQRDPRTIAWTEFLSETGNGALWDQFAAQYRNEAGFLRGWIGTGLMKLAEGVAGLRTNNAKRTYNRLRPFQVDPSIQPIGKPEKSRSYPSGHTAKSYAAATVLGMLWPQRAYEFNWWARQVGLSRMQGGMHFPSDVKVGAMLGQRVGAQVASILY